MSRDTISIHFVNAALTGVKRLGMDVETLLSHVGIEAELLRQPKARISLSNTLVLSKCCGW